MTGVADRIGARFDGLGPQDLDDIDAEITRLQALRGAVAAVLSLTQGRPLGNGRPAVLQVAPPVTLAPLNRPPRASILSSQDERRKKIAAALLSGPLNLWPIVEAVAISQPIVSKLLKHPWFRKTGPRHFDPWELTEEGRAALTSPEPQPL